MEDLTESLAEHRSDPDLDLLQAIATGVTLSLEHPGLVRQRYPYLQEKKRATMKSKLSRDFVISSKPDYTFQASCEVSKADTKSQGTPLLIP